LHVATVLSVLVALRLLRLFLRRATLFRLLLLPDGLLLLFFVLLLLLLRLAGAVGLFLVRFLRVAFSCGGFSFSGGCWRSGSGFRGSSCFGGFSLSLSGS